MYHSITFGEKNTWDDWHLFPTSRPTFAMPAVRTNFIDIPGADGDLDFTEALVNRPLYTSREGDFEFIVENEFREWTVAYSDIAAYIHGQDMKCFLEDDPNFYYFGRFSLNEWKSDPNWSTISIHYVVHPFKYDKIPGIAYDPYTFEKGVLEDYRKIKLTGTAKTKNIESRDRIIIPRIGKRGDQSASVEFTGTSGSTKTVQLQNGINLYPELQINKGTSIFRFTGHGEITLDCRGGQL